MRLQARKPEVWKRGGYTLLSKSALDTCVETLVSAREIARAFLMAEIERLKKEQEREKAVTEQGGDHPDFFRKK